MSSGTVDASSTVAFAYSLYLQKVPAPRFHTVSLVHVFIVMMMISMFDSAPRKCWVCDLANLQAPLTIELLGTVVRLKEDKMTIDDGTGCVEVHFEGHSIKGEIGDNVDCIAKYGVDHVVRADAVIWAVSPQTETLFQWQILEPPGLFGYPTLKFTKDDLLRYIRCAGDDATLENLSLVLDRPANELQSMIHELQDGGVIYMNRDGAYALL